MELPARVVKGDDVALWPLLPVALAAAAAQDWLREEGTFTVQSTCWSRDEQGIFLAALIFREKS